MTNSKELKDIPFFFILSMGRSGSTLLEFLLDAHPNVNIPLESRFIIHLYYKYSSKTNWTVQEKKNFINDLFKEKRISLFWEINKQKLEADIINTNSNISYFELCRIVTANYISFYPKDKIKTQGNKNPPFGLWCDILYQLNKQSKFIHLVRNPLGVISSHKKMGHKNLYYFSYRWNLMNIKIENLKTMTPSNFLTVKYENLICKPEETLKSVCNFLGIDYKEDMLRFNEIVKAKFSKLDKKNDKEKLKMFNSHLSNLVNPIDNKNINSWETILTSKEKKDINYITKNVSTLYGYKHHETGKFKLTFLVAKFKVKYRHLKNRLYYRFYLR